MKELLRDIASMSHLRQIMVNMTDKYSPAQAKEVFVHAMNEKSRKWGMKSTLWINPSGLGEQGKYSSTTARDLALLGTHITDYPELAAMWQGDYHYSIKVTRPYIFHHQRHDLRRITRTITSDKIGEYFPLVFGKTGSGDGYNTLLVVCQIPDIEGYVSAAIMQADSAEARFSAMNELLWAVKNGKGQVTSAKCACAYHITEKVSPCCIFAQDAEEPSAPMSTTKVMSLMVSLDHMQDLSRKIYIRPSDVLGDEGSDVFMPWDKASVSDVMHAALYPSSNRSANALARECGYLILDKAKKQQHY